jgi:hypothetical protein
MAEKVLYCIVAGFPNRPETIERGVLEKGMGQTNIAGDVIRTLNNRGDCGIPNWTEAWAVRLVNGKIPESPVTVNDPEYKGQIRELKWGDPNGYVVICRYLKGYNSIDLLYQDLVLNAKDNIREDSESSADAHYIRFQNGDNFFDPETDPYLCQMLRLHYLNKTTRSRSPEAQGFMFLEKEYNQPDVERKDLNSKSQALNLVNEAAGDNSLKKLKNLHTVVSSIIVGEVKDDFLYPELMKAADENAEGFMRCVMSYKAEVSKTFEKSKSYNVLDLTKDGTIVAGKEKREIIGENIPGKNNGMIDWVFANFLDEKAWEVSFQLKKITEKLK